MRLHCALLALILLPTTLCRADITRVIRLEPGSAAETSALLPGSPAVVANGARQAQPLEKWSYRFVIPPSSRCALSFSADTAPDVRASAFNGKPLKTRLDLAQDAYTLHVTAPPSQPIGAPITITFTAKDVPLNVSKLKLALSITDTNGDGLTDVVERLMGLAPGKRAAVMARPPKPHTSFQTVGKYSPEIAVNADAVLAYTSDPVEVASWVDAGYTVQTMGGFRDGPEYVKQHPGSAQADRTGKPLTCGENSIYMVPTQARIDIAKSYYASAMAAGSTAVCPEEPEMFTQGGYADAFKQEWQDYYKTPWVAPHSSIDARYKAEQLKAYLEQRQIDAILTDAQRLKPTATRMVAMHSAITYDEWGIVTAHRGITALNSLDEVIGQVWTGTARTPYRVAGVKAERTFGMGYMEYSSLYQLLKGTGKRLWFLMDPVEDNPDRPMDDYHTNYEQTLLASLMFADVDRYEVMPWPTRIYGRVPAGFATEINTVVGALGEMWRYSDGALEAGTDGIGTFVSDSMALQRGDPFPSDMNGFYGLCGPFVAHGVPAQVLSLDRVTEPGYLSRFKVLLLSYDHLKPASADTNRALAEWVRKGGSLIVCGGTDAYNDLTDSWWRKAGVASPTIDLLAALGIAVTKPEAVIAQHPADSDYTTVLTGDGAMRDLKNRKNYTIDLTPFAQKNGSVAVRFEDVTKQDGWGPFVNSVELRIGGKLAASFRTGSELEARFLADDHDSRFSGDARFADQNAFWVYRFDNLPRDTQISLTVDMGNGYLVKAMAAPPRGLLLDAVDSTIDRTLARLRIPNDYPITLYTLPNGVTPLYRLADDGRPVVWQSTVGAGSVIYSGVAPGYLTANVQSSRWVRNLARRALNGKYKEAGAYVMRRGPFVAIRALGRPYTEDGRFINLLSPTLAMVEDPEVGAHGCGLYMQLGRAKGGPRVVAVSGRLMAKVEDTTSTALVVNGPSKTEGAARLWCGRRKVAGVRAYTTLGEPVNINAYPDGDTVFLRYPNDAAGVVIRVGWK